VKPINLRRIRLAINDPSVFTPRRIVTDHSGRGNEYEPLGAWSARAVAELLKAHGVVVQTGDD
jgi:hypothetical protein